VTEYSQSGMRGYGPFPEGAEPTAPIGAQQPSEPGVPPQAVRAVGDPRPTPPGGSPAAGTPHEPSAPHPVASPQPSPEPAPASGPPHQATGSGQLQPGDPHAAGGGSHPASGGHPGGVPYPVSGGQSGGVPHPVSGGHSGGVPHPVSGGQSGGVPNQGGDPYPAGGPYPTSGGPQPTSGNPYPGTPSGPPYPTSGGGNPGYGPFQGSSDPFGERAEGWTDTPYGFAAPPGRRIEPSPPPQRSRLIVGLLAGLVAGLVLFGTGGYFAGRATAPEAAAEPSTPAPAPSSPLGVFEQNQVAVNQPDFAGSSLTAISEGWLPYLSTCSRSGTPGGPKVNAGEKVRVRCTLDGMSAIFVEYESVAERDKARVKAMGQAVDARTLTPGVAPAAERPTPSGRTTGNYLEYAFRLTEGGTTRTVSGMWWDDAQAPVAGYLLAYWKEGLGEKWEPMRDLWSRYA
jgi:hypothetical protein